MWAHEHFNIYMLGTTFQVQTDHKPPVNIWQKPNPPLHIMTWRLQPRDVTIAYNPMHDNLTEYMCRHPTKLSSWKENMAKLHPLTSLPKAVNIKKIKSASTTDSTLWAIIQIIQTG